MQKEKSESRIDGSTADCSARDSWLVAGGGLANSFSNLAHCDHWFWWLRPLYNSPAIVIAEAAR